LATSVSNERVSGAAPAALDMVIYVLLEIEFARQMARRLEDFKPPRLYPSPVG
jgi:hypothetical protein